jgi:tetratricopeptide (TPR) repeat protein
MAPEQHEGRDLTAAADQYSFCLALWEALCGEPPFVGKDLAASKFAGPPAWTQADVPGPIADAVHRGLAADPQQRWPSMDALLEALAYDPRRGRNRRLLGLGTATVAALGLTGWASWAGTQTRPCSGARQHLAGVWDEPRRGEVEAAILGIDAPYAPSVWERTSAQLDTYADEWATMHTEACEATSVRREQSEAVMDLRIGCLHRAKLELAAVVGVLATADADVVEKAHKVVEALEPLSRCSDVEALQAEVEPPGPQEAEAVTVARARLAEAMAETIAGRYDAAQEKVDAAREVLRDVTYEPVLAELAFRDGDVLQRRGKYEAAVPLLEKAVELGVRSKRWAVVGDASRDLLIVVGQRLAKPDEGLRYLPLARALSTDAEGEASLRNNLGVILYAQGKYEDAESEFRRALAALGKALGPDHPSVAGMRGSLVSALHAQGKYEDSERQQRLALAAKEKALGPEHPDVALSRNNLAIILYWQGKLEDAEAEHRRALALWEKAMGPEHPDVAGSRVNLAAVLQAQHKYEDAEAEYRRALAVQEKAMGPEHSDVATARNNLGAVLHRQGKYEDAEVEHRRALAVRQKLLSPEHPDLAASRVNLAASLIELGKASEAVGLAEQALEAFGSRDDIPPEGGAYAAFVLARALWATHTDAPTRRRARTLAEQAAADYRAAGPTVSEDFENIEAWLSKHRAR